MPTSATWRWRAATGRRRSPPIARRWACWPGRTPPRPSSRRSSTTRSAAIATPSSGSAAPPGRRRDQAGTDRGALLEETFQAGQQAWTTSAASALAKMTARIGAGDTDLGRRIRQVQDLSERILRLNADDQQAADRLERRAKGDPAYSAALEEFRAASAASAKDPAAIRQRGAGAAVPGLLCSAARQGRRRPAARRAKPIAPPWPRSWASCRRRSGPEPAPSWPSTAAWRRPRRRCPATPRSPRAAPRCATTSTAPRRRCERRAPRSSGAFPAYVALADPKPLRLAEAQALLRADEALVAILVGSAKSFVWALTRERAEWAEIDAGAQALPTR